MRIIFISTIMIICYGCQRNASPSHNQQEQKQEMIAWGNPVSGLVCGLKSEQLSTNVIAPANLMFLLRNESNIAIHLRKPVLGPTLQIFGREKGSQFWSQFHPPGSFLMPEIEVIKPKETKSFLVPFICGPIGTYEYYAIYNVPKESENIWCGEIKSPIIEVDVVDDK
jgi:hypothetical protein